MTAIGASRPTFVTSWRVRAAVCSVLPHVTGLALVTVAAVIVGRPLGWLGVLAAVGPLVGAGLARLGGVVPPWREAWAFGIVAAAMTAGGWLFLRAPALHQVFAFVWPLALLVFMFGAVNYVIVSLSRSWRAARGQTLDYPWIPRRLAAALNLDTEGALDDHGGRAEGDHHGNR